MVRQKGPVEWVVKAVKRFIDECGYGKIGIAIKNDGEPAILAVREAVSALRSAQTTPLDSATRESQTNGAMERSVKTVQGHYRTLLCQLVDRVGNDVKQNFEMLQWLGFWIGTSLNRYKIHPCGKSSFQLSTGHTCRRPIAGFGKKILWKKADHGSRKDKGESNFSEGIFLGLVGRSPEALIGTAEGIRTAYTVRRMPSDQRWSLEALDEVTCSLPNSFFGPDEEATDMPPARVAEVPASPDVRTEEAARSETEAEPDPGVYSPTSPAHSQAGMEEDVENEPNQNAQVASPHPANDDDAMSRTPSPVRRMPNARRQRVPQSDTSSPDEHKRARMDDEESDDMDAEGRVKMNSLMKIIGENEEMIKKVLNRVDLTEIYSPTRINKFCEEFQLMPGDAFDLLTGWDFDKAEHRNAAARRIMTTKPRLLVCSPPCTAFSILQNLNIAVHGPEWAKAHELHKQKATRHLAFCEKLCKLQMEEGRYFLIEHPHSASSWKTPPLERLCADPRVSTTRGDQCAYGLMSSKNGVEGPALKPTRFASNSQAILEELSLRCAGGHDHVHLHEGRAAAAARYPDGLCKAVCRGLKKQLTQDAMSSIISPKFNKRKLMSMIQSHKRSWPEHWKEDLHEEDGASKNKKDEGGVELMKAELMKLQMKNGKYWASDDVSGATLDPELVKKARQVELDYFRKMVVYRKVKRPQGVKTIRTRWVDVNKGDAKATDYRSRLVGMEFNEGVDPSLFAGTPPLEALRAIISLAGTANDKGVTQKIMINDVKRAYFHAKVTRDIYVEIPQEDRVEGEGDMVGKLELCLYGTRDAALNWQRTVRAHLESLGFQTSPAFPNIYHHPVRHISTLVHGDDYASCGSGPQLQWLQSKLEQRFEIKSNTIGHQPSDEKECKILNRIVRAVPGGWEYEADPRHGELLVEALVKNETKGVVTAGVDEPVREEEAIYLGDRQITEYRSLAARGNYLAFDRPDISYAVKELSRDMSRPTTASWERLKRLARYLRAKPRLVWDFPWQQQVDVLDTYTDANWAGCRESRRSTSGGVIMHGTHTLKFWSKTQTSVALSSAESELYASVKGGSESLGMMTLMEDFGRSLTTKLHMDASAAIGIAQRQGVGKIRHLSTSILWIQDQELRRAITVKKIDGSKNPSDLMTKHVNRELVDRHCAAIGCHFQEGRARKAAELHSMRRVRQLARQAVKFQKFGDELRSMINKTEDKHMGNAITELNDRINQPTSLYHSTIREGAGKEDRWSQHGSSGSWIRTHGQPRMELYTPATSWRGPQKISNMSSCRVTKGIFLSGEPFEIKDDWCDAIQRHRVLKEPWVGTTTFYETAE